MFTRKLNAMRTSIIICLFATLADNEHQKKKTNNKQTDRQTHYELCYKRDKHII